MAEPHPAIVEFAPRLRALVEAAMAAVPDCEVVGNAEVIADDGFEFITWEVVASPRDPVTEDRFDRICKLLERVASAQGVESDGAGPAFDGSAILDGTVDLGPSEPAAQPAT